MRCCVPWCKNDTRRIDKSLGLSFHTFPSEPLKTEWLKALGMESCHPRSCVCSEHFLDSDKYLTKGGLRKIALGALPIGKVGKRNIETEDLSLKVCRICLIADVRLYPMWKYNLSRTYEHLTGIIVSSEGTLPGYACTECAHRLINCRILRNKCFKANMLLQKLVKDDSLSLHNIKQIDRQTNQLTSNLSIKIVNGSYNAIHKTNDDFDVKEEGLIDNDSDINIKHENKNVDDNFEYNIDKSENKVIDNELYKSELGSEKLKESNKIFDKNVLVPEIECLYGNNEIGLNINDKSESNNGLDECFESDSENSDDGTKGDAKTDKVTNGPFIRVTKLSIEEQIADIKKRKESKNFKCSLFKCMECFKGFLDERTYNTHMTKHSSASGEFVCKVCKNYYKTRTRLTQHILASHRKRYSCSACPFVTAHRNSARAHKSWHEGMKYNCPYCSSEFYKKTSYLSHIRIKHPSDFVCELCGYSFVSEKGIESHKNIKHLLDNFELPADAPMCERCNISFVSEEAFRCHLKVSGRHAADPERNELKPKRRGSEARQWDSKTPVPCEQCGMEMKSAREYHTHFRRTHRDKKRTHYPPVRRPHMCEECGKIYQSEAALKYHHLVHRGEKPFTCPHCNKSFTGKICLTKHLRVHSDVTQRITYPCKMCGKQFSSLSNRLRHMFVHEGVMPHQCEVCQKSFTFASEKRYHYEHKHMKKPYPKKNKERRRPGAPNIPSDASDINTQVITSVDTIQPN